MQRQRLLSKTGQADKLGDDSQRLTVTQLGQNKNSSYVDCVETQDKSISQTGRKQNYLIAKAMFAEYNQKFHTVP